MGEELELKLSGCECKYAEPFCAGVKSMRQCAAPEGHSCDYRNQISQSLAMCKRYNSAIDRVLARTQDFQR